MKRIAPTLAIIGLALLGTSIPAIADPTTPAPSGTPDWTFDQNEDTTTVGGNQANQNYSSSDGPRTYTPSGPWTERVYMPLCQPVCPAAGLTPNSRNVGDYTVTGPGAAIYTTCTSPMTCDASASSGSRIVFDGAADGHTYDLYTREIGADNLATQDRYIPNGTRCLTPAQAADTGRPVITVDMVMDQAIAVAPKPAIVVQPAATSYVNIPNNYVATVATETVTVNVLGYNIPVRFTPGTTAWDFGDGRTGSGVGLLNATVGAPGAVEHGYSRSGTYSITAATTYTARITFPDGQAVTIDTPIVRTSEPARLQVGEIQTYITGVG